MSPQHISSQAVEERSRGKVSLTTRGHGYSSGQWSSLLFACRGTHLHDESLAIGSGAKGAAPMPTGGNVGCLNRPRQMEHLSIALFGGSRAGPSPASPGRQPVRQLNTGRRASCAASDHSPWPWHEEEARVRRLTPMPTLASLGCALAAAILQILFVIFFFRLSMHIYLPCP